MVGQFRQHRFLLYIYYATRRRTEERKKKFEEMAAEEGQVIGCHTNDVWTVQLDTAKESNKLIVIDFTASWCPPCRMIAPIFADLAKKFMSSAIFFKVDVDELQDVAQAFAVEAMPTFVFIKDGNVVDKLVGARKEDLQAAIVKHTDIMEKLFIPSFPKTCLNHPIPAKVEKSPEVHPKSRKKNLSFTKKKEPNIIPDEQLDYLCRNGGLLEAEKALDSMFQQGSKVKRSTYLNLLESCIDSGSVHLGHGVLPDDFLFPKILQGCANCKDVETGRLIHSVVIKLGMTSCLRVSNSILAVYAKCGALSLATKFFRRMEERDVVAWNSVLLAYCQNGKHEEAVGLVEEMEKEGISPGLVTWNILIGGYNQLGKCEAAMDLMQKMESFGVTADVFTWTAMISGLIHNGKRYQALETFRKMFLAGVVPNEVTIMSAVSACSCLKVLNLGSEVHSIAVKMGFMDDLLVGNSLVDMYSKCGKLEDARKVFDSVKNKDVYTWNSMITGYCQAEYCGKAYELFTRMQEDANVKPNIITWNTMISGEIHGSVLRRNLDAVHAVKNALTDTYGKSGDIGYARTMFKGMETKDIITWNSLIGGYVLHGSYGPALDLFNQMKTQGIKPNRGTLSSIILAHGLMGNVDEGKKVFSSIANDYHIIPALEHCSAMVSLYGRSNRLEEAVQFIQEMNVQSETPIWESFLTGCRIHGDIDLAIHAAENLFSLEPENPITENLVAQIYALGTRLGRSLEGKKPRKDKLLKKPLGQSWIEVRNLIHTFTSGDQSKLCTEVLYPWLLLQSVQGKHASVGPWGGQSGHAWDDGMFTAVRQIIVAHGSGIDSIQVEYDKNGSSVWSEKRGGKGGTKFDKVKLDYPHEYLTSVNGTYGSFDVWGNLCVRSLTFESNRKKYGPFGTFFSLPKSDSKIIGFHGKAGWYLDAIGVHLQPIPKENSPSSKMVLHSHQNIHHGDKKFEYSVIQGSVGQNFDIVVALKQKDSTLPSFESRDHAAAEITKHKLVTETEKPKAEGGAKTYGPWGGIGGIIFDDGIYTGIRQINLSRSVGIVSMKVCYDFRGQAVWGSKHGGRGGFKHDKIVFDYPSEVLTHVTGTYGPLMYMGPNVIKSLTFHTNKGKHGPFGEEQGPSFTHKIDEGKVVGFLGREGLFLDSIGVHVMECKISPLKPSPQNAIVPHNNSGVAEIQNSPWANKLVLAANGHGEEFERGVIKEPTPSGPGPWGGDGGKPWDDGVFSGIKQIFVTRANDAISSIQVEYDRNGQSVWSVKHGGNSGGVATHRIKLEYPNEMLTCISGYYGPLNNSERSNVVKSLTFYTSRGKYGPYGEETGTYFTSTTTQGKVLGLHGRSSSYLDAIGVHMQHWLGNNKPNFNRTSCFKLY
ncbi:unnamed protein product [Thlaspi arvense]|uniref:Jacalin-type lectin domain-containing protein n=1 Tax=Thlaspi arvense TaxID=13288 RepID=A0AAU9RDU8_THLAR|nr:unnamed protein product [Thlaspi arvense]